MIIGIGCDVVDHTLSQNLGWTKSPHRFQKIFSQRELELINNDNLNRFVSGRFAAKEATLKCLGTGMKDGIALTDIQILKTEEGKPFILIDGMVKSIAQDLGINSWHVSISHTNNNSTALVIAENI